jgi:hypothetical protein
MSINTSNYKWYQSSIWNDTATNGGAINTSATITSNLIGNTFATVARAYAITGTTNYRKVYFKNEDLVTFPSAKCYISATCTSTYANIYITPATSTGDTQAQATAYTWYQPFAYTDPTALNFGDMATTTSTGIWLKMVINPNAPGFDANSFTITVIDTYT